MLVPSEYPASVLSTLHTHEAARHARPCVQVARMLLEQDRNNAKVKSDPSAQVKFVDTLPHILRWSSSKAE